MRNLKRALSLALASVMVIGMMVVGTGASYKDVTSEHNTEAIEVLQAVGVMVGDNGNFNPDQKVTRNEMAVIMSNLMDYRVASYKGTSPFTDVPEWAEPYVAACYTNGIIAGYNAKTFGGSDTVSTAQAALMLMKALGYFQYGSDFSNDWQRATVLQGNKIDLFDGIESGVEDAMTRNDVAQLVLNTLQSGMVEADDNTIKVETDGATVTAGKVNYLYVSSQNAYAYSIKSLTGTSNTSISTLGSIVELGEKLYAGKLQRSGTNDAFGRPSTVWTYKSNDIGTYADGVAASWTGKVTEKALYAAAGTAAASDYIWNIWVDGVPTACTADHTVTVSGGSPYNVGNADISKNSGDRYLATGDGVMTELYIDDLNDVVNLVVINNYVAEVTKVVENDDSYTITVNAKTTAGTLSSREFETETKFEKDDVILVTMSSDDSVGTTYTIQTADKAQTVTGKVSAVKTGEYLKLDGTTYNYNYTKGLKAKDNAYTNAAPSVGNNVTLYLGLCGEAVAIEGAQTTAEDYLWVKGIDSAYGSYTAKVIFYDGTEGVIDIKNVDGSTSGNPIVTSGTWGTTQYLLAADHAYRFVKSGDKYELLSDHSTTFATTPLNGANIEKGAAVAGSTPTDINTVYVDVDNGRAYTGYKNVPSMTSAQGEIVVTGSDTCAAIVFVKSASNYDADEDQFFFVSDVNDFEDADGEKGHLYNWTVFMDGKADQTLTASTNLSATIDVPGLYKIEDTDGDGYVTSVSAVHQVDGLVGASVVDYAEYAKNNVLSLAATTGDLSVSSGNKSTFAIDDKTQYLVVELKDDATQNGADDDNLAVKDVYMGSLSNIKTASAAGVDVTGVFVITVADHAKTTPLAELVLVYVPADNT